ncbi:formate dehydrogenase subunit delta [Mesorhizobium sp. CO1-1-7]|uniref:NADH-dependent formate dehydrogenase delta subunit FdsD n=1 Tax=Mesorhizobium australicum (strain HAMBI 3006 / LMG 24608 / WSM2073) TaxID=754035 RepID=L0KBE8_MESAW|nr:MULTISPECIES: formate dehydrogenase subunit delta [Mesorhizobium]MBZ9929475.1 formate dehydrogenase subunit delta [Mesorhizobium sp. BR1-1-5]AGB42642.1 NADH-dependent formate dehydrogenase delta subunit FdsD [Mesorhizobium australicum WSM2073]MBZ9680845.1 formate dehydrogenase subunit delta [Mesorhizobium sp. CO1-1-2]MBZ9697654.1 formate dehydrogenase subunit delta [Mesorhizobium sp. CO1-1-9]MBZ9724202.1 formate dehydrogenase subunit delta [Mesorhizobium sp. CO1-1-11]
MSHDEEHIMSTGEKLVRMANQIAAFFHSRPREEGVAGVAEHINKFWEPRMRRQFFEMLDSGGEGFDELVVVASARIKRPITPAEADLKLGLAASPGDVAASQK